MFIPLAQMPDLETALNSRVAPLYWFVRSQVDPRTLGNSHERRASRCQRRFAHCAYAHNGRG